MSVREVFDSSPFTPYQVWICFLCFCVTLHGRLRSDDDGCDDAQNWGVSESELPALWAWQWAPVWSGR